MKPIRSVLCILIFLVFCNLCVAQRESNGNQTPSLGAYWFVMYTKGSNWKDSTARIKLGEDHVNYIVSLRTSGKIVTGGAFTDKETWLGFEIYDCKTKQDAIKFTEADPMVLSKTFSYEIHPWITLKGDVKFE